MLTKKQANHLRGRVVHLLELAHEHAFAGSLSPDEAQYIRADYARVKREVLDEIIQLTEKPNDRP